MLTDKQKAVIKSTVPLLETGGVALTTHFYELLLSEYPEVRPMFNQANLASGAQPRALANGVLMYAKNIDKLEELGELAGQIVNKHVSLQIQPEHYPIVGACLLRSIREVLGEDIATPEVIEAWAVAYGQLADLLIGAESAVYAQMAAAPGGWRGMRCFRVSRKVVESEEITSFYLLPANGRPVADFAPGQYVGVNFTVKGVEVRRTYSLSAAPNGRDYRISVKREPGGLASNYLHEGIEEGDLLELTPPTGLFKLEHNDKPLVLVSGGVGITPTMAMLESSLQHKPSRPVHFIHCARNGKVQAFGKELRALAARHPQLTVKYLHQECGAGAEASASTVAPDAAGRLSRELLASWLPDDRNADAYFLGPLPFMKQLRGDLVALGVPEAQCKYEFFGPASALE